MRPVYVQGCAVVRSWADASRNLTELIFQGVSQALTDAGLTAADVDGVVLGAHDLVDGRGLTSMVTAPGAAAYLTDEVRLGEDGATALVLGAARVRAGGSDVCVVAAWGRASEGSPDDISNVLFNPFLTRPLGITELSVSALRAAAALRAFPGYGTWRGEVGRRRAAVAGPADRRPSRALPLDYDDLPTWSDVVAAVVLTAAPGPVEISGVGLSSEPYEIGDRDLIAMPALSAASAAALRMAGTTIAEMGVVELDGLTSFDDALSLEAVGAAQRGDGMRLLAQRATVNRDGGSAAGYCAPAMGLVRVAHACQALRDGGHDQALATGSSVVAAQNQAAVVLRRAGSEVSV